jgi:hypothetical protein
MTNCSWIVNKLKLLKEEEEEEFDWIDKYFIFFTQINKLKTQLIQKVGMKLGWKYSREYHHHSLIFILYFYLDQYIILNCKT